MRNYKEVVLANPSQSCPGGPIALQDGGCIDKDAVRVLFPIEFFSKGSKFLLHDDMIVASQSVGSKFISLFVLLYRWRIVHRDRDDAFCTRNKQGGVEAFLNIAVHIVHTSIAMGFHSLHVFISLFIVHRLSLGNPTRKKAEA